MSRTYRTYCTNCRRSSERPTKNGACPYCGHLAEGGTAAKSWMPLRDGKPPAWLRPLAAGMCATGLALLFFDERIALAIGGAEPSGNADDGVTAAAGWLGIGLVVAGAVCLAVRLLWSGREREGTPGGPATSPAEQSYEADLQQLAIPAWDQPRWLMVAAGLLNLVAAMDPLTKFVFTSLRGAGFSSYNFVSFAPVLLLTLFACEKTNGKTSRVLFGISSLLLLVAGVGIHAIVTVEHQPSDLFGLLNYLYYLCFLCRGAGLVLLLVGVAAESYFRPAVMIPVGVFGALAVLSGLAATLPLVFPLKSSIRETMVTATSPMRVCYYLARAFFAAAIGAAILARLKRTVIRRPPKLTVNLYVIVTALFLIQNLWTLSHLVWPPDMVGFLRWVIFTSATQLVALVLGFRLLYVGWTAIQDGHARTTPGKAIGFLFIPVFNLYWAFIAWVGLARNVNAFLYRHRPHLSVTISPMLVGFVICGHLAIPLLGLLTEIAFAVFAAFVTNILTIIMVRSLCLAINAAQYRGIASIKDNERMPDRILRIQNKQREGNINSNGISRTTIKANGSGEGFVSALPLHNSSASPADARVTGPAWEPLGEEVPPAPTGRIACAHCGQNFYGTPRTGNLCPLCGGCLDDAG